MVWNCIVPGKEGRIFSLTLNFDENYLTPLPVCKFPAGFFHVNVYNTGAVCLSILAGPSITVRQILIGIQDLLDNPNPASPAESSSYELLVKNLSEYKKCARQQAKRYPMHVHPTLLHIQRKAFCSIVPILVTFFGNEFSQIP
uniref:UBC core domain-containing protein n=1 Tax=Setaria viridis TaxID=4556 RepID=A0A4U6TV95_SETVI|nr:hypothetical protein SEVIR_7G221700v2 [Setaria viridis]